jgi:hypothetical protein
MNEVFITGKVITEVKFDFILNSKHISVSKFKIMTIYDKQEINITAYDEMADYAYANLKINDIIMINGYLGNNNVVLEEIKKVD